MEPYFYKATTLIRFYNKLISKEDKDKVQIFNGIYFLLESLVPE